MTEAMIVQKDTTSTVGNMSTIGLLTPVTIGRLALDLLLPPHTDIPVVDSSGGDFERLREDIRSAR